MLATYGLKPEELELMAYSQYKALLDQVPNVITYQQTGKIIEGKTKYSAEDNLKWMKEEGLLK